MKLKQIVFVIACLIVCNAKAQNRKPISVPPRLQPYFIKGFADLFVGDKLPDVVIPKIMGWHKKKTNTAEFKDRLLILDFWATSCASCIEALPKMKALLEKYGSEIMILPVTNESEAVVRNDISKRSNHPNPNIRDMASWLTLLPSVVDDRLLRNYFKHGGLPHEVWIYKGKVIGITNGEQVDEANIDKVLAGRTPYFPLKYDFYDFDESKPLFQMNSNPSGVHDKKLSYAAISGYKENVVYNGWTSGYGLVRDTVNKTIRYYFINQGIFASYVLIIGEVARIQGILSPTMKFLQNIKQTENSQEPFTNNKVVWENIDPSKYQFEEGSGYRQNWHETNGICFESVQQDTGQSDLEVYRSVLKDMNRLLGLNVHMEKRTQLVYIIKDQPGVSFKGIESTSNESISIGWLVEEWNKKEGNPYLIEETSIPGFDKYDANGKKRIILSNADLQNTETLKKKLAEYGLDLVQEEREIDLYIFQKQ